MRIAIAAAVACLSIVGVTATAQVHAAIRQHTEIPAEPLDLALRTLAKDRGFQVVYLTEDVRPLQTRGAVGEFTVDEALKKLLSDSRLEYKFVDENTVSIFPKAIPTSALEERNGASASVRSEDSSKSSSQQRFRLALLDQGASGPSAVDKEEHQNSEKKKEKDEGLSEIVVTGTNIRGAQQTTSPLIQYDRAAIEQSGYTNTTDFLQSIPQAFGGGTYGGSVDGQVGPGAQAGNNNEHATAINLRGLGENSTLTLLNGHRIAPSAFGNIVDVSVIPLSAIDHIDVLTDGASAVYGADAVAGVVNIVLRSDYDGAETRATYGGAAGGLRQEIYEQAFGHTWETGSVAGSVQYSHEGTLSTLDRDFTENAPQPTNLINPSTQLSVTLDGHQRIGDKLDITGDVLAYWKHTPTIISYGGPDDTVDDFTYPHAQNLHLGASYALTDKWIVDLAGTYSHQETDLGFNAYYFPIPFGQYTDFYTSTLRSIDLTLNGTIVSLPGGDLKMALGGSERSEVARNNGTESGSVDRSVQRTINAEFAEFYIPIFGEGNSLPLLDKFLLTAAVRRDDYSDFGSKTDPKFGVRWTPANGFDVLGSWSRSFRPPSVGELLANSRGAPTILTYDFANPNGPGVVPVFDLAGENANVGPETATTYSVGFDFHPAFVPGLRITADYYNVDFTNRIIKAPFSTSALLQPSVYSPFITSLASDAAAAAYLANFEGNGGVFIDRLGSGSTGVRYIFDQQLTNAAVVKQNGIDVGGAYTVTLRDSAVATNINAAIINKIDTQYGPNTAVTNLVNTYSNPLRLRLRWGETWSFAGIQLSTAINYSNAYTDPTVVPLATVASWTTLDVSAAYDFPFATPSSVLHGTEIRVSAINLFDRAPPYVAGNGSDGVNYDVGNANPMGRFLSIELRKKW